MDVLLVDAEGALKAAVEAIAGLCGTGNPLTHGVSIHGQRRSPANGTYAVLAVDSRAPADDRRDLAAMRFGVRAVGTFGGRGAAEAAARALVIALEGLNRVTVTTKRGERVLIVACADTSMGYSGQSGGEAEYQVTTSLIAQPA